MKILISGDFHALRTGDYVKAFDGSDEFILDTENCDFAIATLKEIAKVNNIKVKASKKSDIIEELEAGFKTKRLPEMNKMSQTELATGIIKKGFEENWEEDRILIKLVEEGIPFKQVSKMYKNITEELGLKITPKKRREMIFEILEGQEFAPETYDEVKSMIEKLVDGCDDFDSIPDTDEGQARSAIRKYCKNLEIEFPKPPRKPKGGLRKRFLDFAASNPSATDAELQDWFESNTQKDQDGIDKLMDRYLPIVNYGRAVAAAALESGSVAEVTQSDDQEDE